MVSILLSFDVLYCFQLLERKGVWYLCKFLLKPFEQRNVRVGRVSMMSAESEGNEEIVQSRLEPIFFFNNDIDQADGNYLDTYEICTAITEVVGSEKKSG